MATQEEMIEQTAVYLTPNHGRKMRAMVRGQGAKIWDADGNEYIDLFAGFGGGGVAGHSHPVIAEAIKTFLGRGC